MDAVCMHPDLNTLGTRELTPASCSKATSVCGGNDASTSRPWSRSTSPTMQSSLRFPMHAGMLMQPPPLGENRIMDSRDGGKMCREEMAAAAAAASGDTDQTQLPPPPAGEQQTPGTPKLAPGVGGPLDGGQGLDTPTSSTPSREKNHTCPTCLKSFRSKQQLSQHSLVHSGLRKYTCSYCDKAFKQLSHLQQHTRIHTGEKPYKCSMEGCDRAFAQLSNLQHHLRNHDDQVKKAATKQHKCLICHRCYTNENSLKSHTLKMHIHIKQVEPRPDLSSQPRQRKKKNKPQHLFDSPTMVPLSLGSLEGPRSDPLGQPSLMDGRQSLPPLGTLGMRSMSARDLRSPGALDGKDSRDIRSPGLFDKDVRDLCDLRPSGLFEPKEQPQPPQHRPGGIRDLRSPGPFDHKHGMGASGVDQRCASVTPGVSRCPSVSPQEPSIVSSVAQAVGSYMSQSGMGGSRPPSVLGLSHSLASSCPNLQGSGAGLHSHSQGMLSLPSAQNVHYPHLSIPTTGNPYPAHLRGISGPLGGGLSGSLSGGLHSQHPCPSPSPSPSIHRPFTEAMGPGPTGNQVRLHPSMSSMMGLPPVSGHITIPSSTPRHPHSMNFSALGH